MKLQNYEHHARYVPLFHLGTGLLIITGLIASVVSFIKRVQQGSAWLQPVILIILFFITILLFWFSRRFALVAQDRAIRAEENLRYFVITGKLLPSSINMKQVIALRFAPDEELVLLVEKALKEQLTSSKIKGKIKNWKADYNRV